MPEEYRPEAPAFRSSRRELAAALFSYVLGWLYMEGVFMGKPVFLILFTAAFTATALLYFRSRLRQREHWVWLGCLWLCILCELLGRNRVWEEVWQLFIHAYAIYWILALSGRLTEGRSGAFLPLDALNGAVLLPFSRFFTFFRTRVLFWGVRRFREKRSINSDSFLFGLLAAAASLLLLLCAGDLLTQADANFGAFLSSLLPAPNALEFYDLLATLLFSIPVGAYLFGLLAGADRMTDSTLAARKNGVLSFFSHYRHVPNAVWTVLLCVFAVFYLIFLSFQSSYFFGAFRRYLPETFTVAEYARQGFFELCKIMALNFGLLWLVYGSSAKPVREHLPSRLLCSILLGESLLFALTALSKLLLYIDCFGFTPLRLQSFWLVCVLMLGCILSIVSLWTEKKTARLWIFFTGVSLALLHLY